MRTKTKKPWVQTGGGTSFGLGWTHYPSDATYENRRTKKAIRIQAQTGAYFNLPDRVRKPSDLTRRAGVYRRVFKDEFHGGE